MTQEGELMPCPFCGKEAVLEDQENVALCCMDGDWYLNLKSWNSAFCWQEQKKDRERIAELENRLEESRQNLKWANESIQDLNKALRRAGEIK